jgi:hypothetical protein
MQDNEPHVQYISPPDLPEHFAQRLLPSQHLKELTMQQC